MLIISKEFHFSASHVLDVLPGWHPCARMHGHNYIVVVEMSAPRERLTEAGFVRDYRDLGEFKKWLDDTLDHRHLNEVLGPDVPPSAENLAIWLFECWNDRLPELTGMQVSETPKTWAVYRPGAAR
ncbi:6-carboxytetrahydropterin synthase [Kitasatospora sp. YST-16]|uniref:6-pyruvoyl trahydropterin synthase family protein n=1 Tax=Kitasatospora sp. YST-16 TaxID=2998080 RepID=UPI00228399FF|nr:6-carboxytetrahydropterin synthase [Kitasatospora sp. YST-16]WAL72864.1 6-carboxytetrahydropterin synthase [Kitasatospora sp. YST-16]WNW38914.1 6-carboxytetrahydropterin synthase [Streptomyces sp. Li-HN-5-13]